MLLTTSGELVGYKADFSLHLNVSPEVKPDSLLVVIVKVEDLLPEEYVP